MGEFNPDSTLTWTRLEKGVWLLDRIVESDGVLSETYAGGPLWNYSEGKVLKGRIEIQLAGQTIPIEDADVGLFLPPFSVVRWFLDDAAIDLKSLISTVSLPSWIPAEPILFSSFGPFPTSVDAMLDRLKSMEKYRPLIPDFALSPLARKTKTSLDKTYDSEVSLADTAKKLHVPHASMTREFKKAFGIPPLGYRNRVRVMASIPLLLRERSIPDAAHDVGFEDLSRFNKQFKEHAATVPSQFKKKKNQKTP
jgi:AraC-like DNA-binding protein